MKYSAFCAGLIATSLAHGAPSPKLVKNIGKGTLSGFPSELTSFNGKLLFVSNGDLWISDGTGKGTKRIQKSLFPTDLVATSKRAYFYTPAGTFLNSTGRIWSTDGTAKGTKAIKAITPSGLSSSFPTHPLVPYKNLLFFQGISSAAGGELWKSDGTKSGTRLVKDINPGTTYSSPNSFTATADTLFFKADDGTYGSAIWRTDGTAAGTKLAVYGAECLNLTPIGNTLFFCFATGNFNLGGGKLWKISASGAGEVAGFDPFCLPTNMTNVGGTLFFSAATSTDGEELWKSDGTLAGTAIVKDINPGLAIGPGGSKPNSFLAVGKTLYFAANNGSNGEELWRSNGSEAGTYMVRNINPNGDSSPRNLIQVGSLIYFTAFSPATGRELWVSDGTANGTRLIKDIYKGIQTSGISSLVNAGGKLYFSANDGVHGVELWTYDALPKPEIAIRKQPGAGGLRSGASKISFGATKVGKGGRSIELLIKNTGNGPLEGIRVKTKGGAKRDFRIGSLSGTRLYPGTSLKLKIRFKPKKKGRRAAMLLVSSNDEDENPFRIHLNGVAR